MLERWKIYKMQENPENARKSRQCQNIKKMLKFLENARKSRKCQKIKKMLDNL